MRYMMFQEFFARGFEVTYYSSRQHFWEVYADGILEGEWDVVEMADGVLKRKRACTG